MLKKIGGVVKFLAKGVAKSLLPNVIGEIKKIEISDRARQVKETIIQSGKLTDPSDRHLLVQLVDIIDDGKLNDSYNKKIVTGLADVIFQIGVTISAVIFLLKELQII